MDFIEEFEEELFWDELIDRLSIRDLVNKYGPEVRKELFCNEDIFIELENIKQKYSQEFETNGLTNVSLR